jgi:hypothetical protein
MTYRARAATLAAVLAAIGTVTLQAQDSSCTYDTCALRLQHRLFRPRIVQGIAATDATRWDLFVRRVPALESAGDSAQHHYQGYRSAGVRGGVLMLAGSALVLTAVILRFETDYDRETADVAFAAGLVASLVGGLSSMSSRDHLQQAIWHYNRNLRR